MRIPGPSPFRLLLDLPRIRENPMEYLADCAVRYGDLVRFQAGTVEAFFINHPQAIQHVLQTNHQNYTKDTLQYRALAEVTGQGLLTSDGDTWARQRRLAQPAFATSHHADWAGIILEATRGLCARWDQAAGQPLDLDREMMDLALEIVGKSLFGIDLRSEARSLTGAVLTVLDTIIQRARAGISLPSSVWTPANARFRRALAELDRVVYSLIDQRLAASASPPSQDLLGRFISAQDAQTGSGMSRQQLRDEIITMLIAGHETVASALTWTWYLLATHPDVYRRIQDEVDHTLNGREPAFEDLAALEYTRRVFDEALRLYPPAWLITRQSIQADRLLEIDIPARTLVIISPYSLQRHPAFWTRPDEFNPDRFADERPHRYSYLPFGSGPRTCIGSQFALLEGRLILAMLVSRYTIHLDNRRRIIPDALVTIRPRGGLPAYVQPRGNPAGK